jgi:hypothetical protein
VTRFALDAGANHIMIGCVGAYGVNDGGIEAINLSSLSSEGFLITEAQLGGDIGDFAWNQPGHSFAIISDASFNTSVVSFSTVSHSTIGTVLAPGGFSLPDCELNARGELYVCDNKFAAPGIFVYNAETDALIAGPIATALPPYQIAFP